MLTAVTALLAAACMVSGCASAPADPKAAALWPTHADDAVDVAGCRELLQTPSNAEQGLDLANLSVLNWNVQKGEHASVVADLDSHGGGSDLILLQEAAPHRDFLGPYRNAQFWSFAPGYVTDAGTTGVLTLSATMPVARCSLVSYEPWLRTPKATSITQFSLTGSEETLAVVNVHAINFTVGTRRFAEQFEQIAAALAAHDGPIILSGDFNTWRPRRQRIIDALATQLELSPVAFQADRRKQVFGNYLDHVYVRGLDPVESSTAAVTSSDHNPLVVRFVRDRTVAQ